MGKLRDAYQPLEELEDVKDTDLRAATDETLYIQRILRILFTVPGELYHRPEVGAGLQEFQNKPPSPGNLQRIHNRIASSLDSLPFVEGYTVEVWKGEDNLAAFELTVDVDGQELTTPEVKIGNP